MMKARPVKIEDFQYVTCDPSEATHLLLLMYGHFKEQAIRIRGDHPVWNWNGDVENPTLSPSILTTCQLPNKPLRCHCFVRNGMIEYLSDCNHEFASQTLPLREHP